jgi:uncharacterized protein involved in outer membrane biogenesis
MAADSNDLARLATGLIGKAQGVVARRRRWFFAAAILLVVYAAVGFILLPLIVHQQLEKRLATALHRHVTIAKVRMNPFALSVTIDGLRVDDPDGSAFLSWDRLYLNASLLPLIKRDLALDKLYLLRFRAHASLRRDGTLNFEDLLTSTSSPQAEPLPDEGKKRWFAFGVNHLSIVEAEVEFSDASRKHPFATTVGPVTFQLERFRTRADANSPYAFEGSTESGERFSWSGSVRTEPFRSSGTIAFENLRLPKYGPYYEQEVAVDLRDGRINLRTNYDVEWGAQGRHLKISEGDLALRGLAVFLQGRQQPALQLAEMNVAGISADVLERTAAISSVTLRGAVVRARREPEGRLDITALVPPPRESKQQQQPFRWSLQRVELADGRIEVEDAVPERPVSVVLAPIEARVENVASAPRTTSTFDLSVGWNGTGTIKVNGTAALHRPAAELSIHATELELPALDPYLQQYGSLAARLGGGRLSVDGRARLDLAEEPVNWVFDGDVLVDGFSFVDAQRGKALVSWRELRLAQLHTAAQPAGTSVQSVRWVEPRLALEVAEDGSSNLQRILQPGAPPSSTRSNEETPPREETALPVKQTAGGRASAPYPLSIGTFQILRGTAGVVDRSIRPAGIMAMSSIGVRARNLSTDVAARSSFSLNGVIGGAPLKIAGILSPRLVNDATDLKVTAKGIDLTPVGPYVGKYLGYQLEKGKLDLDLQYKVARRQLEASNVARLDQFNLGDSTNSPSATKLPVKLALAVLRDRDGLIELDVPITGNVDDPNFRLGRVIWHAVVNVLTKVATAPFTMLGKLLGGSSEKLDVVDFEAGASALTSRTEKTLQALAKALYSRPALKLDVEGSADEAADGHALRLAELHRRAREAKWKALGSRSGAASPDKVEVLEDEYAKFIEMTYRNTPRAAQAQVVAATPAASQPSGSAISSGPVKQAAATPSGVAAAGTGAAQKPTLTEMEERLLATMDLAPEAIPGLAKERAEVVRARIVESAQVDPTRLFLTEGSERAKKEGGARVYFALK